jgi:hypothetical protein
MHADETGAGRLIQTDGEHGLRFAGPDLLDCVMMFKIEGGEYDGERLKISSHYHPCCGTLEVNANLMTVYKRWRNKLDGCAQHRREGGGDIYLRKIVWNLLMIAGHEKSNFSC